MLKRAFLFAFFMAAMACSGSSKLTPASPSPAVSSVAVTGTASLSGSNLTSQLTATEKLSNATDQDVSTQATWSSSNPAVATVSALGLVTAVTMGTTTISAAYQSRTGTLRVSVLSLNVASVPVGSCAAISINGATGTVSAQVNGVAQSFCLGRAIQGSTRGEGSIEAQQVTAPFFSILIIIPGIISRGTYTAPPVAGGHVFTAGMADSISGGSWSTTPSGGSGRLTVTTAPATGAAGTFSFTAVPGPGSPAPGTVLVTNGVFTVTSWSR